LFLLAASLLMFCSPPQHFIYQGLSINSELTLMSNVNSSGLLLIALIHACFCHVCRGLRRYESTQDGFIDRDEFAAGLARMGLSYEPTSLSLDDAQQGQLLEALFRDAAAGPASDRVSHDVFDANLAAVRGLDFMADTYMLLDTWCYNSRCGWMSVQHVLAVDELVCAVLRGAGGLPPVVTAWICVAAASMLHASARCYGLSSSMHFLRMHPAAVPHRQTGSSKCGQLMSLLPAQYVQVHAAIGPASPCTPECVLLLCSITLQAP
jgi:hypothetical protein